MNKAIIALDYTAMDEFVIKNSRQFLDKCQVKDLTFIHVVPNYLNINNLCITDAKLCEERIDNLIKELINKKIEKVYGSIHEGYEIKIEILEGTPYTQLINYMKTSPTDLFVTGKKHKSMGSGITSRRIANHMACNVLFVTEEISDNIMKIGVPVDFSDNAARAIKEAQSILDAGSFVQPVHVISHTPTDHYLGLNYNTTYRELYLNAANKEYHSFLKKHRIDESSLLEIKFLEDTSNNISSHLIDYFSSDNIDLVVMGARGHNALNKVLYGSVAAKFVDYNDTYPTLIIR